MTSYLRQTTRSTLDDLRMVEQTFTSYPFTTTFDFRWPISMQRAREEFPLKSNYNNNQVFFVFDASGRTNTTVSFIVRYIL